MGGYGGLEVDCDEVRLRCIQDRGQLGDGKADQAWGSVLGAWVLCWVPALQLLQGPACQPASLPGYLVVICGRLDTSNFLPNNTLPGALLPFRGNCMFTKIARRFATTLSCLRDELSKDLGIRKCKSRYRVSYLYTSRPNQKPSGLSIWLIPSLGGLGETVRGVP